VLNFLRSFVVAPASCTDWFIQQQGGIGAVSDGPPQVFNRRVKRIQRDAAASRQDRDQYTLLRHDIAERLVDRLEDTLRVFPVAAEIGCADGALLRCLQGRGGVKRLLQCDSSQKMLDLCESGSVGGVEALTLLADEEALPLATASQDLILSNLALHWVNDVPGPLSLCVCVCVCGCVCVCVCVCVCCTRTRHMSPAADICLLIRLHMCSHTHTTLVLVPLGQRWRLYADASATRAVTYKSVLIIIPHVSSYYTLHMCLHTAGTLTQMRRALYISLVIYH